MHPNNIPYFHFYPYCFPHYYGYNMVLPPNERQFLPQISTIATSFYEQSKISTSENSQNNHQKHKKKAKTERSPEKDDDQSFIIKSKKKKHSNINQKQNRNVISNVLRSFLKYLSTKQAKETSQRIKDQYCISTSNQEIKMWLQQCGANYRNYVRSETIHKMIRKEKGQKSRLFIMLYRNYAQNNLRVHFLTSSKLKQENKADTLASIRQIGDQLNNIYLESISN